MEQSLSITGHESAVHFVLGREFQVALHFQAALELAAAIRWHCDLARNGHATLGATPTVIHFGSQDALVRNDSEDEVSVLFCSKYGVRLPIAEMQEIGSSITAVARQCEEVVEAPRVARDAGLALRLGLPFGLTSHPVIQAEAVKIARDDRDFRRFLPGGIRGDRLLGAPVVSIETRTPFERATAALNNPVERPALVRALRKGV